MTMNHSRLRLRPFKAPTFRSWPLAIAAGVLMAPSFSRVPCATQGYGPQLPVSATTKIASQISGADMDGDGRVDLVMVDGEGTEILILYGLGGGEFSLPRALGIPALGANGVAVFDATGDGHLDVMVTSDTFSPSGLLTYSRSASGEFQLVSQTTTSGVGNERLEPLDLDGDGDIDLLMQPPIGSDIPAYGINDGLGSFTIYLPPAVPLGGVQGAAADIDGDGHLDLLLHDRSAGLAWWPYLGGGTFGAPVNFADPLFDASVLDIEAGDLDGDGDSDIVVGSGGSVGIGIFLNDGGTLSYERALVPPVLGNKIELGDFDADGDLDVLAMPFTSGDEPSALFRNAGGLLFSGPDALIGGVPEGGRALSAFDATGDGLLDIFMTSFSDRDPAAAILSAAPVAGGYALEDTARPLTGRLPGLRDYAALDFDGDGDVDLVSSTRSNRVPLTFHENIGADRFRLQLPLTGGPTSTRLLDAGDVDGDGKVDLVTTGGFAELLWLRNIGGGALVTTVIDFVGGNVNAGPVLGDLDGDGDLDIVVSRTSPNEVVSYEQLTPGTFGAKRLIASAPNVVQSLVVKDLDGDGVLDVAALMGLVDAQSLRWFRGVGNGSFSAEGEIAGPIGRAASLHAVDLDGSDTLDLVWVSYFAKRVFCAQGTTGGAFSAPVTLGTVDGFGLRMGIMESGPNKDIVVGVLDTTTPITPGTYLSILPSLGGLNYGPEQRLTDSVVVPMALGFHDLDADGDLDVVSASQNDERLAWHRNLTNASIGSQVCGPANPNSTGRSGRIAAYGSAMAADGDLTLRVLEVTPGAVTLFLVGSQEGFLPGAGGSEGNLCLAGTLGRFQRPGELDSVNADGTRSIPVRVDSLPQPSGFVPILAGQTWTFQAWHRDVVGGVATSNFTSAVTIAFL